jgi:spore maturation protein CgeB
VRILLYDTSAHYPASPLFLDALRQLSRQNPRDAYELVDEERFSLTGPSIAGRIVARLLPIGRLERKALNQALVERATVFRPDAILICKGSMVAPETLGKIKAITGATLVNYATDDPFNCRVSNSDIVRSIPQYDLYVCTKRAIMDDVRAARCPNVVYLPFGYKPAVHFPEAPDTAEERARFSSDVAFIGGSDQDRMPYFTALVNAIPELKLALYGGLWNRVPSLRRYWRGFALGRDYRMALGGTKVALNLVRRANRDGHVMRSFEIPACGAFMLAERTAEHLEILVEGRETAFFNTPEELVEKVRHYLASDTERGRIASAGYEKVTTQGHTYFHRLIQLIDAVQCMSNKSGAGDGAPPEASAINDSSSATRGRHC